MGISEDRHGPLIRLRWIRVFVICAFLVLLGRLWYLTIPRFLYFEALARRNHIRTIPRIAPRGLIYDREQTILADNALVFNLVLFREEAQDLRETFDFLRDGLQLSPDRLQERRKAVRDYSLYQPLVIKEKLSMEEIAYLLSRQTDHPELGIFKQPRRIYPYRELAAHVLGHVGEVSSEQLLRLEFQSNRPGDIVGQYGIERTYNRQLGGKDGQTRLLVNSLGKTVDELGYQEAVKGKELHLTIDADLQAAAEGGLGKHPGVVVAFNPQTGEVLVMASRPAFDPNGFAARLTPEGWNRLVSNPSNPLQNRAIQSTFPPGSIFKVVTALAGLETGAVDSCTSVYCSGSTVLYGHEFRCWRKGGHGRISLQEAIRESCNVYFYLLGRKLGIGAIEKLSRGVGLGVRTGIDLPGEVAGLVPSPRWKERVTGQPWYAGETISVAIGQGPIQVTPLQLARAIGIIATGQSPTLHLVRNEEVIQVESSRPFRAPPLREENLQLLRRAMWSVVNQWGTGQQARVPGFEVCGKTGTAQIISEATRSRLSKETAARFLHNAWFVGFAPRDDPGIVIAVLVERGGTGGNVAAPIAGKILQLYYQKQLMSRCSSEVAQASRSATNWQMQ